MTETKGVCSTSTGCLSASCSKIGRSFGRAWRAIKNFDQSSAQKLGHGAMALIWLAVSAAFIALAAYVWDSGLMAELTDFSQMSESGLPIFVQIIYAIGLFGPFAAILHVIPIYPLILAGANLRIALCHPKAQTPQEYYYPEFHDKNSE